MNIPPPSPKQARLIWAAASALSLAVIVIVIAGAVWGLGRVLQVLSPVIWPLAVAGVLAYLLDPVVDFLERRRIPRTRAIGLVFLIALFLVLAVSAAVLPRLIVQTQDLVSSVPRLVEKSEKRLTDFLNNPPQPLLKLLDSIGMSRKEPDAGTNAPPSVSTNVPFADDTHAPPLSVAPDTNALSGPASSTNAPVAKSTPTLFERLDQETVNKTTDWVTTALKAVGGWLANQVSRLTGLFGVIAGLALIPIYLFYLLLEKRSISKNWTHYLPAADGRLKEELIFVIKSINDYLIAFFRGQVLVAICDGVLYGIGFTLIGLPYGMLIGAVAMVLTIIPFLGAIVTCASALLIALVTFGDWQHPLLVVLVFTIVQGIEGYILQPKILGDRVGLHPMVIIVAIMTGTTLFGGILGGILAIPLAAALRVILWRYIWKVPETKPKK